MPRLVRAALLVLIAGISLWPSVAWIDATSELTSEPAGRLLVADVLDRLSG